MRCAILIIGSLWWDEEKERPKWRSERLDADAHQTVKARIRYGRKSGSRSNTYTMVLDKGPGDGTALLVPCKKSVDTIDDLLAEARALWKAEAPTAAKNAISAKSEWGCVGAMFRNGDAPLKKCWSDHYHAEKLHAVAPTNDKGLLDITWPQTSDDDDANFDIILATTNQADAPPPCAKMIAKAWTDQCGHENYFFNNVRDGIRTADDLSIWKAIETASPCFLEKKKAQYADATKTLCGEASAPTTTAK